MSQDCPPRVYLGIARGSLPGYAQAQGEEFSLESQRSERS